jgi:putative addiction module CopG family antidote
LRHFLWLVPEASGEPLTIKPATCCRGSRESIAEEFFFVNPLLAAVRDQRSGLKKQLWGLACGAAWARVRTQTNLDIRSAFCCHSGVNISLTPELEAWVDGLVRSGLYRSPSKVIRDGLCSLHQKRESALEDRLERLLMVIAHGLARMPVGCVPAKT